VTYHIFGFFSNWQGVADAHDRQADGRRVHQHESERRGGRGSASNFYKRRSSAVVSDDAKREDPEDATSVLVSGAGKLRHRVEH